MLTNFFLHLLLLLFFFFTGDTSDLRSKSEAAAPASVCGSEANLQPGDRTCGQTTETCSLRRRQGLNSGTSEAGSNVKHMKAALMEVTSMLHLSLALTSPPLPLPPPPLPPPPPSSSSS
ncbi:unnamed protein product [Pleuronectes platessa]|uniref:Uncharacterized protein n=1 Tax=Pleuronectes platessa TaxID=8262 RepID=A0A9N7V8M3_PLEPL|nr:unnamed protein product [Pleuronectes platessa]